MATPRKTIAKKPAAKKVATKKPATKKTVTKKSVDNKAAVKKPLVKKAAAKAKAVKKAVVTATAVHKAAPKGPQGFSEQLLDAALKILDERQADEIVTVPLVGRSSVADYMIIASGRAGRQIVAIADYLREAFFKLGARNIRVEGKSEANWVLVDAGDIIIHLFRPEVRSYYDLDNIWNKSRK